MPRRAAARVAEALGDMRVVLVNGARQSGKSTLVRRVGRDAGAAWYTLDNAETRGLAEADPTGFVHFEDRMIIDEIQRTPELLLSIKERVDEDPEPGRFLLTGSARVLGLRDLPDTLVGRMETIELWPLSQGEIDGTPDAFVDAAFELGPELRHASVVSRDDYIERIVRGGFPDAIRRSSTRRADFLTGYVADLINRDVVQLSEIERGLQMRALVRTVAGRSGQPIAPTSIGSSLGLGHPTVSRYLSLLEEVFLIKRIPAWTRRLSARAVSQQKVAMVDSGVAAAVLGLNEARLRKPGAPLGELLEGLVAMEIGRQLTWSETRADMFHYRTRDGVEVDLVLEDRLGRVVGIEVKASATPRAEDFRGLQHLADRVGDDLVAGFVLHTGARTLPFGPKFRAVPISALWQVPYRG
ncbi:ATP-binding protein [Nocardioides albus]|uniref:ATP-binding protein n=1 Tax=Nocardioides albus TaxID=1841 RepID=UPI001E299CBE|nr:ATP-binding protein [Nocardioides albus]